MMNKISLCCLLLSLPLVGAGQQITVLDEHFTHRAEGGMNKTMGFCLFEPRDDWPDKLTSPHNFAQGTAHFRLRVLNKPTTATAMYNFGFQQGEQSIAEHFSKRVPISTAKTYTWKEPLSEWWQPDDPQRHVDFTKRINRLMVVFWDETPEPNRQLDDRWGFGDWLTDKVIERYFSMEVHFQVVLVAKGAEFEGFPTITPRMPDFSIHTIDNQGTRLAQTSLTDVDRDGDLDWVSGQAYHSDSKIWWWEYQGPDQWVQHFIGYGNTDVGGDVYDLNGDGWIDLLSGTKILLNTGKPKSQTFTPYEVGAINSHDSEFVHINGDDKMDAIANSDEAGLFWYEIPADPTQEWISHTIATAEEHEVHGGVSPEAVGDMDGDGDADVVTGEAWYENLDGEGLEWKAHLNIDLGEHHRYGLAVRTWIYDLDGDGDNDFVQSEADNPDGRITWFENDGSGNWTRHMIKDEGTGQDFHSLIIADFDGDGDMDIYSGGGPLSAADEQRCYIWENTAGASAKPTREQWIEHLISKKACHEAVGADVDGDGDIDICTKPWSSGDEHVYMRNLLTENAAQ